MIKQEKYLNKAINEIKEWHRGGEVVENYPKDFSDEIIRKLEKAKKAESIEELDQLIKEVYRYKNDCGPLNEIMPSLNQLGVAIEKFKSRSK